MGQRSLTDMSDEFVRGMTHEQQLRLEADPAAFDQAFKSYWAKLTFQDRVHLWGEDLERHTVLLAFSKGRANSAGDVCNNGTGSLIDTGAAKLLVTNYHVYDHLKDLRDEDGESQILLFGAHGINGLDVSEAIVLGRDDQRDLAVLHIPERYVAGQGKTFFKCPSWPPPRPRPGMPGLVYGYPVEGRVPQGNTLGARPNLVVMRVGDAARDLFTLASDGDDVAMMVPEGAEPLTKFCGMSGGAVYVLDQEADSLVLAGFMYKASFKLDQILATYADHINADGTIRGRV
jgi:hypothetical protein